MPQILKNLATGIAAGLVSYQVAVYALARTSALVLPKGFPLSIWQAVVVFGLGVTLVAFLIHFIALTIARAGGLWSFVGHCTAFVACLAFSGLLVTGIQAFAAAAIGAGLATLAARLRSNNSFKPMPLRGTA